MNREVLLLAERVREIVRRISPARTPTTADLDALLFALAIDDDTRALFLAELERRSNEAKAKQP